MKPESYEKLTRLKQIIGQMSISDKVAFVTTVSSRLTPDMLKTIDGRGNTSVILTTSLGIFILTLCDSGNFKILVIAPGAAGFMHRRLSRRIITRLVCAEPALNVDMRPAFWRYRRQGAVAKSNVISFQRSAHGAP